MTQEQIKDYLIEYAELNANNETVLKVVNELINSIINDICYNYPNESNKLTTCYLIIKELLENV